MSVPERIAEEISETLGLCGYGKDNNWSVKVADFFFVDCGCCWFWRGVILGALLGILGTVASASLFLALKEL